MSLLVLRAHNVPHIKKQLRLEHKFYVTVTNRATTKKTTSVSMEGGTVQWDQKLNVL